MPNLRSSRDLREMPVCHEVKETIKVQKTTTYLLFGNSILYTSVSQHRPNGHLPFLCHTLSSLAANHRVHRVATAAFWRTFSHEGKISAGW
jgi:hypothetical protein